MDMLVKHYKLPIIEQKQISQQNAVIGPRLAATRGRIPVQRPAQIPKPAQNVKSILESKQSVQQAVLQNVKLVQQRQEQQQKDAQIVKNAQNAQSAQGSVGSQISQHNITKAQPPVQVPKPGLFIRPFVKRN
jgi:hypothetical protein